MRMLLLILLVCIQWTLSSQTLKVSITGLRNNSGNIVLAFYNTEKAFEDETPLFTKVESKAAVVNHILILTYNGLKPGVYGIVILDDENNNSKMDFGWILPEEGFGFSNYYHTGMLKPKL